MLSLEKFSLDTVVNALIVLSIGLSLGRKRLMKSCQNLALKTLKIYILKIAKTLENIDFYKVLRYNIYCKTKEER